MKFVLVIAGAVLISGCVSGPVALVHRPGSTFADRQAAVAACRAEALEKMPPQLENVYDTPTPIGPRMSCRFDGIHRYCSPYFGDWGHKRRTSRDANAPLRDLYVGNCLKGLGYSVISRPICASEADKAAYTAQRDNQAPEAGLACVDSTERLDP